MREAKHSEHMCHLLVRCCRVALNRALTAPLAAMGPSLMDDQNLEFSLLEAVLFKLIVELGIF